MCPGRIAHAFGRPNDPARHRILAPLGFYRRVEIGVLAFAESMMQAQSRWTARSPAHDPWLPLRLSLRTMLDAGRAAGIDAWIGFALGKDGFIGHLT